MNNTLNSSDRGRSNQMTSQSELYEQVSAAMYDTDYKHVIEDPEYFDRAAVDAVVEFITANYIPINQPSTNTAPVTDDNTDKPSTNELYHMLIDHMQNMLTNPQPVDVDYGAHLLDRLLGEREQEAYKRGYKARQAPEVENTI